MPNKKILVNSRTTTLDSFDPTIGTIIVTAMEQGWLTTVSVCRDDTDTVCFNFERDCPRFLSTPILIYATMTGNDIDGFLMDLASAAANYNTDYIGLYGDIAVLGGVDIEDYNTLCNTIATLHTDIANLVAALAMAL